MMILSQELKNQSEEVEKKSERPEIIGLKTPLFPTQTLL